MCKKCKKICKNIYNLELSLLNKKILEILTALDCAKSALLYFNFKDEGLFTKLLLS